MNDITIRIVNPIRPYIAFFHENDGLCGYMDCAFPEKGVLPIDLYEKYYRLHKTQLDEKTESLYREMGAVMERFKDFWIPRDPGFNPYEWLIQTPIDELVSEECAEDVRLEVQRIQAKTAYTRYIERVYVPSRFEADSYMVKEMYNQEFYSLSNEEQKRVSHLYGEVGKLYSGVKLKEGYVRLLHLIVTNDLKVKTDIEQHLYDIYPTHGHLRQLEPFHLNKIFNGIKDFTYNNDWVGFVLNNPSKEQVQATRDWLEGKTYDYNKEHFMHYNVVLGAVQDGYKVMFMSYMRQHWMEQYPNGSHKFSNLYKKYSSPGHHIVGVVPIDDYKVRKQIVDDWFSMAAGENDYCLISRGNTLDVRKKDGVLCGSVDATETVWPFLRSDKSVFMGKGAQYYIWETAADWSNSDKRERLFHL